MSGITLAREFGEEPPVVDAYYDATRKEYLVENSGGRWLSHDTSNFKRILRKLGVSTAKPDGALLSPADKVMLDLQDRRDVRYAGPLAGRNAGFYEEGGIRFLATISPRVIDPVPGSWPLINQLLTGLLREDSRCGDEQFSTFMSWLKIAYEALRARSRQPGQALVLAGPVQCGKSLLQSIITEVLGGRAAKAFRYFSGATDFNSELFAAEHLYLEDEQSTTDTRSRLTLGANIKAVAVNEVHSCHAKGRDAVNLRPFWRLSISLNDEAEHLMVLPPVDEHIADKLILLKCEPPKRPFPTGAHGLRDQFWREILSELPAFVHALLNWRIPDDRHDERFGVRYFHNPELLQAVQALAPEMRLLELLDLELWNGQNCEWEGTASDLEQRLSTSSKVSHEARKLLSWQNATGTYLGRLSKKRPERIEQLRTNSARTWKISSPSVTP